MNVVGDGRPSRLAVRYTACNARKKNAWNMNEMNKINKVLVCVE